MFDSHIEYYSFLKTRAYLLSLKNLSTNRQSIYQDLKHLEKGKHQMKISYFKPYIELFSSLNKGGEEF